MKTLFGILILVCVLVVGCEQEEVTPDNCDYITAFPGYTVTEVGDSLIITNRYWKSVECIHLICMFNTNSIATVIHLPSQPRVAVLRPEIRVVAYHVLGRPGWETP